MMHCLNIKIDAGNKVMNKGGGQTSVFYLHIAALRLQRNNH
jgi:hypothetical protein